MSKIEYLDRPPADMFVLEVMCRKVRARDWVALMIDVDPDGHCGDGPRATRSVWVRIPRKHRDRDAAWEALEDLMATGIECEEGAGPATARPAL